MSKKYKSTARKTNCLYFATIISQDSANTVSVIVVELQLSSH